MIRTVIPKMRSFESLIYCGGKWQLLQLSKISFLNLNAREHRCGWDNNKNNHKIHHQRAGSFLITRRFKKGFCRSISSEREAKENVDPLENKRGDVVSKHMENVKVSMTSLPWALLAWSVLGFPVPRSGVWGHRTSPTLQRLSWRPLKQIGRFKVCSTMWDLSVGTNMTALSWWQERFLMAGKRQLSHLSLQRARTRIWGAQSPKRWWSKPSWICCVPWLGAAGTDLAKTNWAWPISSPSVTEALQPRAGWQAACTSTLAKLLPSWDRQMVTWVENGPNCQARRTAISSVKCSWLLAVSLSIQ